MAREKTLKAVYTFHTTTEAMKMEQCARGAWDSRPSDPCSQADQRRLRDGMGGSG